MQLEEETASEAKEGLVIAHLGQGIAVEHNQAIFLCQPLRKLETIAVGDKVVWHETAPGQGRIEGLLPRRSLLARPSRNNKCRPVAANIDTVFVVIAVEPACDFLLVDQYLAVCENSQMDVALILNKMDLAETLTLEAELAVYQSLGYKVHQVSTKTSHGINELNLYIQTRSSLLAGQSGVGKTSITNAIIPDHHLKTNAISQSSKLGRHTTTAATLYHIGNGGDLIDTPGVAIFGLADLSSQQLAEGYREFKALLNDCKFNDCSHQQDKGCAIRAAAESGKIAQSRYQRFLKLTSKLARKRA